MAKKKLQSELEAKNADLGHSDADDAQFAKVVTEFRKKQKDLDAWAKNEKETRVAAVIKELKDSKKDRKKQVIDSGTTEQKKLIERQENKAANLKLTVDTLSVILTPIPAFAEKIEALKELVPPLLLAETADFENVKSPEAEGMNRELEKRKTEAQQNLQHFYDSIKDEVERSTDIKEELDREEKQLKAKLARTKDQAAAKQLRAELQEKQKAF